MRIGIVHLSDIHFRIGSNPTLDKVANLAAAATSDPTVSLYLVVISGDIARTGDAQEYSIALQFFGRLKKEFQAKCPGVEIIYITVPGNHDCMLPEAEVGLREALIQGLLPSIHESRPDDAILKKVLEPQSAYEDFCKKLPDIKPDWNGICETVSVSHSGKTIQINLYNTALASRRKEIQGQLYIPTKVIAESISLRKDVALSLSIFHHSYVWLESNDFTSFRGHIERTTDVALTGHQHFQHSFYKANSTGERVLYLEGAALQDDKYPQSSAFHLLILDLDSQEQKLIHFKWAHDIYSRSDEKDWHSLTLNRGVRTDFRISETFEHFLNELGTPFTHRAKQNLSLRDLFVCPDFVIRSQGPKANLKNIRGEQLSEYVAGSSRILFQAASYGGKTTLGKVLFLDLFNNLGSIPIFMRGQNIRTSVERRVLNSFWAAFNEQYSELMLETFKQLGKEKRTLIIDDWDCADLNIEGRRVYLNVAANYFEKIILFTGELFQMEEVINKSPDTIIAFDHVTIREFGYVTRGRLIDKWVKLGREHNVQANVLSREIEETESLVLNVIGKNTLPPIPFVILCILQAEQEDKAESPEAGSFGYLYEVLVTTLLSTSAGRKTQLEKKYIFLSILAYQMFKEEAPFFSVVRVREIAEQYSRSHLVKVDIDALLSDLESARVLTMADANYSFAYPHLFYYFVARYYKDNLDREGGAALREEINEMVEYISSDRYSTVLMFILYFARDSAGIINKLASNADRIYPQESPANLDSDIEFLNALCDDNEMRIPEHVDTDANRQQRREMEDRLEDGEQTTRHGQRKFLYSDALSDGEKFHLAIKHIDILGQVLRNFPGSLPGSDKLVILRSTYLLGLRLLSTMFRLLQSSVREYEAAMKRAVENAKDSDDINDLVNKLIAILCRIYSLILLLKISSSVGLADLQDAYVGALKLVGETNATNLIDIAIKLDHFDGFPDSEVRRLHKLFSKDSFADMILKDLVLIHIQKFDVSRPLRQSLASLFEMKANAPVLTDSSRKK